MSSIQAPQSTKHLVAPELAPGLDAFPGMDFDTDLNALRTGFSSREMPPLPPGLDAVQVEERAIPGIDGAPDVRVLVYTPPSASDGKRPAILHIHGGGYVVGRAEISDIPNRMFALTLNCVVVSVDYRKSPEAQWPEPRNDCYAALLWMNANADALGIDTDRIAIAGESAGGGHAAAVAIHARNVNGPKLCLQLLDAPMLDDRTGVEGHNHPYTGEFVWTPKHNRFGWGAMLGVEAGSVDVRDEMVPARAADVSGLPPAFISVGALDLFLEEDMEYTRRLTRAGVPAELYVIPGAYHGFGIAGPTPQSVTLNKLRTLALARAFGVDLPTA